MPSTFAFAREFLQVTQESALGTIITSPVRGTSQLPIRLSGPNQFTARFEPVTVAVMYGGGLNIEAATINDKHTVQGKLVTELCYSQALMLLPWAMNKINSGQTLPWVTTEPPNQYASCTIDHAYWLDDSGAYKRQRYVGCKVDGFELTVSEESQKAMLSLDITGQKVQGNTFDSSTDPSSTAFPQPADTEYPTDFVKFIDSGGGLTLSGSTFAQYRSLSVSGQNQHSLYYYANRFPQAIRSYGRKYKMDSDVIVLSTPDFRSAFQYLTPITGSVVLTNTTHTITLNFQTNARYESLQDDLKLAETFERKLSLGSRFDTSVGTDFTCTVV